MFCCFDIKNQTVSLDCSLLGLGERRGREGTGRGEEEGSDEPSALEGSLEAGGGHSGWGPAVGFARLAARLLLPHSFQSQVTGGRAGGGLGRLRELWGLQHHGHAQESGLPLEEASPPVSWGLLWGDPGGGGWLPQDTRHFCRNCYWKWSPGGTVSSRGWP